MANRVFDLTEDDIANAIARDSFHCPIADVISRSVPNAQHVTADLGTIRWTDPVKRKRYFFITPLKVQQFIVDIDRGYNDRLKPFRFALRTPAQIIPMRDRRPRSANEKRKAREAIASKRRTQKEMFKITKKGEITKLGGTPIPARREESGNIRRFRRFGARELIE